MKVFMLVVAMMFCVLPMFAVVEVKITDPVSQTETVEEDKIEYNDYGYGEYIYNGIIYKPRKFADLLDAVELDHPDLPESLKIQAEQYRRDIGFTNTLLIGGVAVSLAGLVLFTVGMISEDYPYPDTHPLVPASLVVYAGGMGMMFGALYFEVSASRFPRQFTLSFNRTLK